MILPQAAAPLEDCIFYFANPENILTEKGQKWVEAFHKHWNNFMNARKVELKKDGIIFITVIINQEPLLEY